MKNSNLNFDAIASFVRACGWRVVLRGVISLGVVALIAVLYLAFAPRSEGYKLELQVALPEKDGVLVYENNSPFSVSDIVAAPILHELWTDFGFAKRGVKFDDFSSCFSIYNWNKERAAIDAELAGKLAKRNITVADIASAQEAYDKKLATLDKHSFVLSYVANGVCSDRDETARMLTELPLRWAARARRVYAPPIPTLADAESVKAGLARFEKLPIAEFDTIDYLQQYCRQLMETCAFTLNLMKGKNLSCDGITAGKLKARIDIAKRELNQIFVVLLNSQNTGKDALRFAKGRRDAIARDMMTVERQIAAVKTAVTALSPSPVATDRGPDTGLTLQADGNFIGQYTDLVKQSVHADKITKYIDDQVRLETDLANLKSRDLAYAQVEQTLTNATVAATASGDILKSTVASVIALGADVERFRDYVMDNSMLPGDFFTVQTPVYYAKSYKLSLPRFILGLLALWALYNLICLVRQIPGAPHSV